MGSLIIVLIAVAIYCSEAYCDTLPTTIAKPEDTELDERNDSHTIEKGVFWKNLDLSRRKPTKMEESRNLNNMSSETSKRKSRFLSSLAFLAGLSFGGLATAASSTMKSIAKIPRGSFSLNLDSTKTSPYIAAYYSPYSLIPYPFFYPGHIGLVPMIDPAKPQTTSHNDLKPQVISLFDNRQPIDLGEDNEEYAENKFDNDKSMDKNEEADDRMDSRGEADRNAEEKTTIHECKGGQRKRGNSFKGLAREREDLHVDADDSPGTLNFQAANMTVADANQTVTENSTMTMTTDLPQNTTHHHHHHHHHNYTERPPFPGYFGGYPQNINHVDLTTGSNAYHYQDHGPINYNVPYERPVNFYHDGKYNVYSNPPVNPHYSGPFLPDQINEYAGTDFNRFYQSDYQPSYSDSFKPVK